MDGTLIRTDRCQVPGPTARTDRSGRHVDLWWSGKHAAHGGNIQVIAAPDGWPLWTSPVRPGREHDTTALRGPAEALPLLTEWTDGTHAVLADLGYEGERAALTTPIKHRAGRRVDHRPAHREPAARGHPSPGRTRQLPAQDHVQGTAPGQPLSLAYRRDHRRRSRSPPSPTRPDHVITDQAEPLLGMAQSAMNLLGARNRVQATLAARHAGLLDRGVVASGRDLLSEVPRSRDRGDPRSH